MTGVQTCALPILMATDNDTGEYVINALDMSDTMERIFEEYESMEE